MEPPLPPPLDTAPPVSGTISLPELSPAPTLPDTRSRQSLPMKNFTLPALLLVLVSVLWYSGGGRALAAPTDIVPRGSTLLDAFAKLAQTEAFGASDTPEDFLGEPLYTRGQLAALLKHLLEDEPQKFARVQKDSAANSALHAALQTLQPELRAAGVDVSEANAVPSAGTSVSGYVQPELRLRAGGDKKPGSGGLGVYRVTALGSLRSNIRYSVSASNWAQDRRRVFDNDIGPHDFPAINEAYLELDAGRGLTVDLGRMQNRWGSGSRGATLLSDNAPPLDQLQVSFPFSLGPRLGRNYQFSQLLGRFSEGGQTKYVAARRIELALTPRLTADLQEAFKTSRARGLVVSLLPDFYSGKNANLSPVLPGVVIRNLEDYYNAVLGFGLAYAADPRLRVYGQFALDDLRSPGKKSGVTPRKIAYLVGFSARPLPQTGLTAEYSFADPTTYTFHTLAAQWQKGQYDEIGLPSGPNTSEVYVRLDQKLTPRLSLGLSARDRRRHDLSFPAPTARDLAATASYSFNTRSGVQVIFHDYRQDAFPIDPSVPVGNGFQPSNAEGNYGQRLRIRQLDVSYQFFF